MAEDILARTFWQAPFSKEKEKAAILASASHTVAERRGIGGYVEASNTPKACPIRWCLRKPHAPKAQGAGSVRPGWGAALRKDASIATSAQ